ncbi:ParB/RepB/Spo0J family partition protein [Serratia marcescens]|uniref:ParB/RepB/Spo0J family partition protein n=1 Tax=Serratia marcescens TaxID=615 RepID=UPI00192CA488|nr:ParB/RepB/Spo0J family partition protein [Serratia marcescens]MBL5824318.1 ParB/RepB/Spo0J family partition protein [Serratia marcescens]
MNIKKVNTPSSKVQASTLESLLSSTPVIGVPLAKLVKSDLNVRKRDPKPEAIAELAASILAVGVLQNLVVCKVRGGKHAVVAGGRRLLALQALREAGDIDDTYPVPCKAVPLADAVVVSLTENGQREDMHPADQIAAFRALSEDGQSAAQIAGLLGYSTRHVQKLLKLAAMHPNLLALLAVDEINLDQLQALASTDSPDRQMQAWEVGDDFYNGREPAALRRRVLNDEIPADGNAALALVGLSLYEAAGGEIRHDLFSDCGFVTDPLLLDTLTLQALETIAAQLAAHEGWAWSMGRAGAIITWGDDREHYSMLEKPTGVLTELEQEAQTQRGLRHDELIEEGDAAADPAEAEACYKAARRIEEEIRAVQARANIAAWDAQSKVDAGVVVSFCRGELTVQRGVVRLMPEGGDERADDTGSDNGDDTHTSQQQATEPQTKGYSAALLRSLTAERTLAVQAALTGNPQVALALLVHTLLIKMTTPWAGSVLGARVSQQRGTLLTHAPASAETDRAMTRLGEEEQGWMARLPKGWEQDFTVLIDWPMPTLVDLLAFCVSGGIDGLCEKTDRNGRAGAQLDGLEAALGFTLRDWWVPTAQNCFARLSKDQIGDALVDADRLAQAASALKMKKADAAVLAEAEISQTRWVPPCLTPYVPVTTTQPASDDSDAA